ncbi:Desaturase 1 [Carabus blaptoides fortunei]
MAVETVEKLEPTSSSDVNYKWKIIWPNIKPVESLLVSFLAGGEGWHNYHHTFPWDYRASEFGTKVNVTTHIIDMLAYLGLAYDLRTASKQMVQQRIERTGDGTKTK